MNCIAHKNKENGKEQTLLAHLENTARYAAYIGGKINFKNISYILGILHDIGKSSSKFQDKIRNDTAAKVDHSTPGAYCVDILAEKFCYNNKIDNEFLFENFNEILKYVIEAHHGIFDTVRKDEDSGKYYSVIENRILKYRDNEEAEIANYFEDIKERFKLEEKYSAAFKEYINSIDKIKAKDYDEFRIYRFFYIRLFISILKSADIYDTINATDTVVERMEITDDLRDELVNKLEEKSASFGKPKKKINEIRQKISNEAKESGKKYDVGIYRLDIPVGGGKTISSMRYACHNLKAKKKDRIIYLTSYLSVLEQNAAEIKSIFGKENTEYILEHHSNIVEDETVRDDNEISKKTYFIETWDDFVVLSTTIQFLNTLIKDKSSNIRRFDSLINSIIIIDEVQSLPLKVTYIFNMAMNFLKCVMDANIVLCTATQPPYGLEDIKYRIRYGDLQGRNADIVTLENNERELFKRVECRKMKDDNEYVTLEEIAESIRENKGLSTLIILNTKKAVKKLYDLLDDNSIYYLTTYLCAKHRLKIIREIKEKLKNNEKIICISTQLIEAGVDVDFDRVIRSYAGIDSIIQASGRCNREGRYDIGYLDLAYLHESEENIGKLKEIKDKKTITESIMNKRTGVFDIDELSKAFFERYYRNNTYEMNYVIKNISLIDMIVKGAAAGRKLRLDKKIKICQQFKKISKEFNVIDNNTVGVIVPYDDTANDLIEELIKNFNIIEEEYDYSRLSLVKRIVRRLQPYTVDMYKTEKNRKLFMEYMKDTNMPVYILSDGYYDKKTGIIDEIEEAGLIF